MTPATEKGLVRRSAPVLIVALAVIGAVVTVFMRPTSTVLADDANHTTTFALGSNDFDGTGPVPAALASMRTTDSSDDTWKIDLYRTPSGGVETLASSTSISRADGESSGCDLNLATAPYPSGTSFRAHFETRSSTNVLIFSYDRYAVKP
jgi:hypothetical protein